MDGDGYKLRSFTPVGLQRFDPSPEQSQANLEYQLSSATMDYPVWWSPDPSDYYDYCYRGVNCDPIDYCGPKDYWPSTNGYPPTYYALDDSVVPFILEILEAVSFPVLRPLYLIFELLISLLFWLSKFVASWFFEWPNRRRLFSTTMPWNVRISLLVLWGVCWMFFGDTPPTSSLFINDPLDGAYPNIFHTT
jgi:hypothetical protein